MFMTINKMQLYQEIAESIRKKILYGILKPNDALPTVRDLSKEWQCAPGTALRAIMS
jgi:GntR family transcriptional regulator